MKGTSKSPRWLPSTHLLEAIGDGVLALDSAGKAVFVSARALQFLKLEEGDVLGCSLSDLIGKATSNSVSRALLPVAEGHSAVLDCSFPSASGADSWARISVAPVRDDDIFHGSVVTFTDIADLKEAGLKQRASRAQFDAVFENLPFECWLMERDGSFVMQNQLSIQRLGKVGGQSIEAVDLPDDTLRDFRADLALANAGQEARRDVTVTLERGRKYFNRLMVPIRDADDILGVLGVCVDTTARRTLEDQLAQSQKLDAVGRLAGGIAHDFNNVLTAIMSCVRLLERRLEGPPRRELQIIRDGAQRASGLTRQLLAFAKQEMTEPRRTSIDEAVIKSDRLLRRLIGEDIELVTLADAKGWDVVVDPVRLEQAIINLVVNARDALPKGGKITVRCCGLELSDSRQAADGLIPPGSYAQILVEDSGTGMSEETKARAFEPFFTTRQISGGTGLGLSSVYGSVHQAKGYVTLESALGEGTSVGIFIPRADPGEGPEDGATPEAPAAVMGGTETILLVEDEPMVMSVTCQTLRMSGYTVLEARGLEAAMEVASTHPGVIDLLLTDVVMPKGTGPELAEKLRVERPDIALLFMSGYTPDRIDIEIDAISFLAKPFTSDRLEAQVRRVLDARTSTSKITS